MAIKTVSIKLLTTDKIRNKDSSYLYFNIKTNGLISFQNFIVGGYGEY